jgi:hypothetical protein
MLVGTRYFLGLAMMQVCGGQVVLGAHNGANVWRLRYSLAALATMMEQLLRGARKFLGLTAAEIDILLAGVK